MRKFAAEFIRGAYEVIAFFMFISTITVFFVCVVQFFKIYAKHGTRSQSKIEF